MKSKKVAIVSNCMPQYRVPIYRLLSSEQSNEYTIITGSEMPIPMKMADTTLASTAIAEGGIRWVLVVNKWIFNRFLWQKGLFKELKAKNYDTIIMLGTMYYLSTWAAAIIWRMRGKKIVFWSHGFLREENNLLGFLRTLFYKLADEFLLYGQRGKDIMVRKGFNPRQIKIVYNSLDYDNQVKIRSARQTVAIEMPFKHTNLPIVGYIGRVLEQKKLDILIEAVQNLYHEQVYCNVLIIGDGPHLQVLKSLVIKLGLTDHFYFYGSCYDENTIYQLLIKTNVIVSPGEIGLTAIHAMTYGIPVITHDKFEEQGPEYACIQPGLTGDFFNYEQPLQSLTQLLKEWFAKSDRASTIKACYKIIDDFYNPHKQIEIINSIV